MDDLNRGIKILNGSVDNVFIAVQIASNQSGYSDQYLRKMLRHEIIQGIKIGQLWLIECKSLLEYIEEASTTEDLRYGSRIKIRVNEKPTKQE
jgi:hypothetical protein